VKITDVKPFIVHPTSQKNWLLVKVETDEGLYGWGECYTQVDRDKAIEAHVLAMKRYLVGRNPFDIKHTTTTLFTDWSGRRGAMDYFCAVSGIEHALWDILGKAANLPVHVLLGGKFRERIRVYANAWSDGARTPEALAERAKAVVARGFTALKFDPLPHPFRTFIDQRREQMAIDKVAAVREAVGPDVDILIDTHRHMAPMHAVRLARGIERYNPFWFEEPVLAENVAELAEVKRQITIPVVTGEELYTKHEFREVFERRAADVINPDICNCGGILELKEIAAMAEPYDIVVSPHNANSVTVALAASLQLCAHIPNFLILEYFLNFEETGRRVQRNPFKVENGYVDVPMGPGLNIEIEEEALAEVAYQDFPLRRMRTPAEEGP